MPGFLQRRANEAMVDRSRSPNRNVLLPRQLRTWIESWAWGKCPAIDVVRHGRDWIEDNRAMRPLDMDHRIVRLAKAHANPGNAERVVSSMVPLAGVPPPVSVPDSAIQLFLPPFDILQWLRRTSPAKFEHHLGASPNGVSEFWRSLRSSASGQELWDSHPWLRGKTPRDLKWHLPLVVFDDSGPFTENNSVFVRCFYSILGQGSEKHTRFLISTGVKVGGNPDTTPDRSWEPIMQSFDRLAGPAEHGSWGGILLFVGADLEYACNVLGLQHYNGARVCMECKADTVVLPHNNFAEDAEWRTSRHSPQEYLDAIRRPLHDLVRHPFFNRLTYRYDLLHLLDHHGLTSQVVGNILYAHLAGDREADVLPGTNTEERLGFLNADILAFYQANHVSNRLPALTMGNIKSDIFPELKGNGVKAANSRSIMPYIAELQARAVALNPTRIQRHMLRVAQSLNEAYNIFYCDDVFLSPSAVASLGDHLTKLGRHYQVLQNKALADNKTRWKTLVKTHYVVGHLAGQAALINPRAVQSYASESMVGQICGIYKGSRNGPYLAQVQSVTMTKYRTGLKLLWE